MNKERVNNIKPMELTHMQQKVFDIVYIDTTYKIRKMYSSIQQMTKRKITRAIVNNSIL